MEGNVKCLRASEWEPKLWENKWKELRTIGPDNELLKKGDILLILKFLSNAQ